MDELSTSKHSQRFNNCKSSLLLQYSNSQWYFIFIWLFLSFNTFANILLNRFLSYIFYLFLIFNLIFLIHNILTRRIIFIRAKGLQNIRIDIFTTHYDNRLIDSETRIIPFIKLIIFLSFSCSLLKTLLWKYCDRIIELFNNIRHG